MIRSLSLPVLTLLTEFLIGQKNLCVFVSKENQPHFFQLPVGRQKIVDRARRNFGGFSSWICVDTGRDRRKGDRTQILLDSQSQRVVIAVREEFSFFAGLLSPTWT